MTLNPPPPVRSANSAKPPALSTDSKLVLPPKLRQTPHSEARLRFLGGIAVCAVALALLVGAIALLANTDRFRGPVIARNDQSTDEREPIEKSSKSAPAKKESDPLDNSIPASPPSTEPAGLEVAKPEPIEHTPLNENALPTESNATPITAPKAPSEPAPSPAQTAPDDQRFRDWPIAPVFPTEPAMSDGKPSVSNPVELLKLADNQAIAALKLLGVSMAESGKSSPLFRLDPSSDQPNRWSLTYQRNRGGREVATISCEADRLLLEWNFASIKQIATDLRYLSVCGILVSLEGGSKKIVPFSFEKTPPTKSSVVGAAEPPEFTLLSAVINELVLVDCRFSPNSGEWTNPPQIKIDSTAHLFRTRSARTKSLENQFVLEKRKIVNEDRWTLVWQHMIGGRRFSREKIELIRSASRSFEQVSEYKNELKAIESELEAAGRSRDEGRLALLRRRQELQDKLDEVSRTVKSLKLATEDAKDVAAIDGWPDLAHGYLARSVEHNGREILIPLVQFGEGAKP